MSDDAKRPPDAATRTLAGPRTLAFPKVRLKVLKGPDKGMIVTLDRGRDPDRRRRQRAAASHRPDRVAQPLRHPDDGQGTAAARSRVDERQSHRRRRGARGVRPARRDAGARAHAGPLRAAGRIRRAAARRLRTLRPAVGAIDGDAAPVRARRPRRRLRRHRADRRRDRHRQGRAAPRRSTRRARARPAR